MSSAHYILTTAILECLPIGLGMSILDAIVRYPLVGHHRAAEKKYIRRTDREVLSLFSR
ncbi:MAG: hypothetical protein UZ21_OP11001000162 [Microgenomates bacterium OLB22]|nr:MAG: hypothetical protein UZ21_OP11001000162 [Microgenomates bacterium OLB22]